MNDTLRALARIPMQVWQRGALRTHISLGLIAGGLVGSLAGQYWITAAYFAVVAFLYIAGSWAFQELDAVRARLEGGVIVQVPPAGRSEIDVTLADGRWISGYLYEKADR